MSSKAFFLIAGTVFGIVAIAHLQRIFMAMSCYFKAALLGSQCDRFHRDFVHHFEPT